MKPETIVSAFPYLYENVRPLHRDYSTTRSSYAMKHDVEHLVDEYCAEQELKDALRDTIPFHVGTPTTYGEVSWGFYVKPKFDLFWLRVKPTSRPKGARLARWEAYQTALAWATQHHASQTAPAPASGSQ